MTVSPFLTWTPSAGPVAGTAYELPPINDKYQAFQSIPDTYSQPEMTAGEYDSSGSLPPFLAGGILPLPLYLAPRWLIAKGYTASFGGMMSALGDFQQAVTQGGLGTLVNTLPPNTVIGGATGATYTSRALTGKIFGQPQYEYENGKPVALITIQIKSSSGVWTYSPGGLLLPIH